VTSSDQFATLPGMFSTMVRFVCYLSRCQRYQLLWPVEDLVQSCGALRMWPFVRFVVYSPMAVCSPERLLPSTPFAPPNIVFSPTLL